ncbi:hypothetical protein [Gilliamella sp. wkB112]|uniref:hypothetical protein n=1 Tax=Gilliamella sp. wkB112 TaxID=3120257 RepID=UPI00080ECADB|nr:hypothetical protein [Gilliamella apicola]OCG03022.1 hypothetical protein A9G12_08870 [Gilliamella apicola]
MKKVLLISLVSIALTGCGDDKVTKEYLVGKWDCSNKEYESKYDSKLKAYTDYSLKRSEQYKHSYKIVDGVLVAQINNEEAAKTDIDKVYKQPTIEGKRGNCEFIINRSLIKNSSNKFTWELEMFYSCSNLTREITKTKSKNERVCTRIE